MRNRFSVLLIATVVAATMAGTGRAEGPTAGLTVGPAETPTAAGRATDVKPASGWDKATAARYLDAREIWWQQWPHAAKDHGTVCLSCHTNVPYALVRPALRQELDEPAPVDAERVMLDSVLKRVSLGDQAAPFYNDKDNGAGKTQEARNAEAVLNALTLVSYDAPTHHLSEPAKRALDQMWALQEQSGPRRGAWVWQNFHYEPWEGDSSEYYGAAMAAVATGKAPESYRTSQEALAHLVLLRLYLTSHAAAQPPMGRLLLLWASGYLPDLMPRKQQAKLAQEIYDHQNSDGGWNSADLGGWKRQDGSTQSTASDGYATGLAVVALEDTGIGKGLSPMKRGLGWLRANQRPDGSWPATSVNKNRDPASDVGKFMSDAATAYAVLALEKADEHN